MTCANCGAEVESGASFCSRCGATIAPAAGGSGGETAPGRSAGAGDFVPTAPAASSGIPPYPPPPPPAGSYGIPPYPSQPATPFTPYGAPPPGFGAGYPPSGMAAVGASGSRIAPFGAPLAGWWQRVGAAILDGLLLGIPFIVLQIAVIAVFGKEHDIVTTEMVIPQRSISRGAEWTFIFFFLVLQAVYFSLLNGRGRGQTPGNRAPGIAVRDLETGAVIGGGRGFLRWFVRFFLYAALIIPGILNDLYPLWDARSQSLADKAARSVMIRV